MRHATVSLIDNIDVYTVKDGKLSSPVRHNAIREQQTPVLSGTTDPQNLPQYLHGYF
ncbi:hypothetical protein ACDQ55_05460 [Chitinophaga sp. 30R24]|uniref:hypothetical protein n=1 Tax=Chitinophaga sp. 30R24 TaxID=3248838 RepID=UPI003B8FDC33